MRQLCKILGYERNLRIIKILSSESRVKLTHTLTVSPNSTSKHQDICLQFKTETKGRHLDISRMETLDIKLT